MDSFQKQLKRERQIKSALLEREASWDSVEEVLVNIGPDDLYRAREAMSLFVRGWLADNGWGSFALDWLRDIEPTKAELREAEEEQADTVREFWRSAL